MNKKEVKRRFEFIGWVTGGMIDFLRGIQYDEKVRPTGSRFPFDVRVSPNKINEHQKPVLITELLDGEHENPEIFQLTKEKIDEIVQMHFGCVTRRGIRYYRVNRKRYAEVPTKEGAKEIPLGSWIVIIK